MSQFSAAELNNDPDCPKCGWGVIGCAEERTGCTNRAKKTAKL